ncbi:MAG TPA: hypothetical protein PKA95_06795 [Thermomicrobiales bacterium]|nr:hypothetical protein [Thermomicrobiales bacterium]
MPPTPRSCARRCSWCCSVDGTTAIIDYHYLIATPEGIEHLTEHHRLGLFTDEQYASASREAGLRVRHDARGLGRGLFIGTWPGESHAPTAVTRVTEPS